MKSKMKSAFALIAVALMVMVAVVPMIGVFTEDSEATIVKDPSTDTNEITVTVYLYKTKATPTDVEKAVTDENCKIKIEYGSSYSQTAAIADKNDGATFKIYEASVSKVVVSYVDKDGADIANFGKVEINGLTKGNTYTANVIQGKVSKEITFQFKNGVALSKDILGDDCTITAKYEVYSQSAVAEDKLIASGTFDISSDYKGTLYYPYASSAYYRITQFNFGYGELTFPETTTVVTTTTISAEESLVTINSLADSNLALTVDGVKETVGEEDPVALTPISTTLFSSAEATENVKAYFFGTLATTGNPTYSIDLSAPNNTSVDDLVLTLNANKEGTITLANAFYGQVYMSDVKYTQAGTLTVKLEKTSGTTSISNLAVDSNGRFFRFVATTDFVNPADITGIEFKSGQPSVTFKANDKEDAFTGASFIAIDVSESKDYTYSKVAGTLKFGTNDIVVEGAEINVTGAKTFASRLTDEYGAFDFLAEKGNSIELGIAKASLSGSTTAIVGTQSETLAVKVGTQTASIKVVDALGANIAVSVGVQPYLVDSDGNKVITDVESEVNYGKLTNTTATSNVYKADVRADLDLSTCAVYFDMGATKFTFEAYDKDTAVQYEKDKKYESTAATFTFQMLKISGAPIYDVTSSKVVYIYVAEAYKTSAGTIIYDYGAAEILTAAKYPSTADDNAYTFIANYGYMQKSESSITNEPTKVILAMPGTDVVGKYIFKNTNVLTSDSDGYASLTAKQDTVTGKVLRNDGTPIAGVAVTVTNAGGDAQGDVSYTSSDGSFTAYSDKTLVAKTYKLSLVKEGYPDGTSVPIYKNDVLQTSFKFAKDVYAFAYEDADGTEISLVGNKVSVSYEGSAFAVAGTQYKWESGKTVQITMVTDDDNAYTVRTFAPHILTDAEVSTGEVTFVSDQALYTFVSTDADGYKLTTVNIQLYRYVGDQPIEAVDIADLVTVDVDGVAMASIRLPYISETGVADDPYTEYGYVATHATYKFSETVKPFELVYVGVMSISETMKITMKDADNEKLTLAGLEIGTMTVYDADDKVVIANVAYDADKKGYLFIGDSEADYTYTITKIYKDEDGDHAYDEGEVVWYTFPEKATAINGVVNAFEQWIVGDVLDAEGKHIITADTNITATYYDGTEKTGLYDVSEGNFYKVLVDVDEVEFYSVDVPHYTFVLDDSPIIVANEQTILFSAVTANGCDLLATFTNSTAFNIAGERIGFVVLDAHDNEIGLIVDVEEVAYYQADVAAALDIFEMFTFDKQSLLPVFIANESYITGSVPFTGKVTQDKQKVTLDLYLEGNQVATVSQLCIDVDEYEYDAIVDLSGMVVDGVVFDSIVATYYESGVALGAAVIDPFSTVNNIISPIAQQFIAELIAPSAIIALHVDIAQVGNTATVTADGKFIVADDESIYTDGQYIYTFAGWYVDNEKVSANPVFTFTMTESVVISPQYTVVYEKISDVNKDVEKEYVNIVEKVEVPVEKTVGIDTNVLIIGICAVIVALIAVVYAVIKKE